MQQRFIRALCVTLLCPLLAIAGERPPDRSPGTNDPTHPPQHEALSLWDLGPGDENTWGARRDAIRSDLWGEGAHLALTIQKRWLFVANSQASDALRHQGATLLATGPLSATAIRPEHEAAPVLIAWNALHGMTPSRPEAGGLKDADDFDCGHDPQDIAPLEPRRPSGLRPSDWTDGDVERYGGVLRSSGDSGGPLLEGLDDPHTARWLLSAAARLEELTPGMGMLDYPDDVVVPVAGGSTAHCVDSAFEDPEFVPTWEELSAGTTRKHRLGRKAFDRGKYGLQNDFRDRDLKGLSEYFGGVQKVLLAVVAGELDWTEDGWMLEAVAASIVGLDNLAAGYDPGYVHPVTMDVEWFVVDASETTEEAVAELPDRGADDFGPFGIPAEDAIYDTLLLEAGSPALTGADFNDLRERQGTYNTSERCNEFDGRFDCALAWIRFHDDADSIQLAYLIDENLLTNISSSRARPGGASNPPYSFSALDRFDTFEGNAGLLSHEVGHGYGANDEYASAEDGCCNSRGGYPGAAHRNNDGNVGFEGEGQCRVSEYATCTDHACVYSADNHSDHAFCPHTRAEMGGQDLDRVDSSTVDPDLDATDPTRVGDCVYDPFDSQPSAMLRFRPFTRANLHVVPPLEYGGWSIPPTELVWEGDDAIAQAEDYLRYDDPTAVEEGRVVHVSREDVFRGYAFDCGVPKMSEATWSAASAPMDYAMTINGVVDVSYRVKSGHAPPLVDTYWESWQTGRRENPFHTPYGAQSYAFHPIELSLPAPGWVHVVPEVDLGGEPAPNLGGGDPVLEKHPVSATVPSLIFWWGPDADLDAYDLEVEVLTDAGNLSDGSSILDAADHAQCTADEPVIVTGGGGR
jgi:hypothetical protein